MTPALLLCSFLLFESLTYDDPLLSVQVQKLDELDPFIKRPEIPCRFFFLGRIALICVRLKDLLHQIVQLLPFIGFLLD
jgi:hypothetical protein